MTRPRQITDKKILEVARSVFLELGPSVSTATVADRAGISQAVLFQRFGTKEKLLMAALKPPEIAPWYEVVEAGPDERDLRIQLGELGEQIMTHLENIIPTTMVLRSSGICGKEMFAFNKTPPPIRGVKLVTEWMRSALEQGRISGRVTPEAAAMMFVGALQARVFLTHISGDAATAGDRGAYLDSLISLLWNGLAPTEEL
jgi:AcrR family transcriptional regulator